MDATLALQFWLVGIVLVLTPGPDWAYAIASGVRSPRVAPAVAGMVAGHGAVVVLVAVGLGALLSAQPSAMTALTLVGAAYLMYLGIRTLRAPAGPLAADSAAVGVDPMRQFLTGTGISGVNPKGLILLLALLPQFTSPTGWAPGLQMLALGGLHLLNCAVVYSVVGVLANRVLSSRPSTAALVSRAAGILMTGMGAALLLEKGAQLL